MVTKSNPDTILLHGRDDDPKDGEASGTVTPGELIEQSGTQTSGASDERQFQRHSDSGGPAPPRFALEYEKTGRGIDDDYSSGDAMEWRYALPGDEVFAFLKDEGNVSIDDPLESAGDGSLQAHSGQAVDEGGTATYTIDDDVVVAYATEAVNNTGGTGKVRIRVEVA